MTEKRKKRKRDSLRLRIAISLALASIFVFIGLFSYINSSKVQSLIYRSVNKVSDLKIHSAKMKISLASRTIILTDALLINPSKNQEFRSSSIKIKFRFLPLLRGKVSLRELLIDDLNIDIGVPTAGIIKKGKKVGLGKLLLLKNLEIKESLIKNISVKTQKNSYKASSASLSFNPSFWGKIRLSTTVNDLKIERNGKPPVTIEKIAIGGRTDVNKWMDNFPYIDDLSGIVNCSDIKWKNLDVTNLKARLYYSGNKIEIKPLAAKINNHEFELTARLNTKSEEYSLDLKMIDPIYLPHLSRETSFLNTSGLLKGNISLSGKGLDYKTTEANINLDVKHELSGNPPLPALLKGKFKIAGGKISIADAILTVGKSPVKVTGDFNYVNPNINLDFSGKDISVETVLNRFQNKHYKPTRGIADATGKVTGWKPNLKFNLEVTARDCYYYDMAVEKLKMTLAMTYNHLELIGRIFQNNKETGDIVLKIEMGKMLASGDRHKKFDLVAKIANHNLEKTMSEYDLKGIGNATLKLNGTPDRFDGGGNAEIINGFFKDIPFTKANTDYKLNNKEMVFGQIKINTTETNPATFPNPIVMDIAPYGVRFHGEPRIGLSIDAKYLSSNGSWNISKISYASLKNPEWISTLSGTMSEAGALNLSAKGTFDTSVLTYLRSLIRESSGPAELSDIKIRGTTENPTLFGTITLRDNIIQPRDWGYYFDKVNGELKLTGNKINIPKLYGRIEYGDFDLSGVVTHRNMEVSNVDIIFDGRSVRYSTQDRSFRMEFDCKLGFKGGPNSSFFSGDISILDGRYTKDFSLFETLKSQKVFAEVKGPEEGWKNIKLDLNIKNNGELKIDNNIGKIWLNPDLSIKGTSAKPRFSGNVDTVGGEIQYAGLDFEVTRGYMEFRDPYTTPYIDFTATKEVGSYNVELIVKGRVDKLYLDLSSTPPLDRKNILALLTYGVTTDDLEDVRFGYKVGTGLVAEQVGAVLQKPVTKYTPLDTFRIEATPTTRGDNFTRLKMGKTISDRVKLNFITDINAASAEPAFEAEYTLTDFLLLKGQRTAEEGYQFNLTFRFREQ